MDFFKRLLFIFLSLMLLFGAVQATHGQPYQNSSLSIGLPVMFAPGNNYTEQSGSGKGWQLMNTTNTSNYMLPSIVSNCYFNQSCFSSTINGTNQILTYNSTNTIGSSFTVGFWLNVTQNTSTETTASIHDANSNTGMGIWQLYPTGHQWISDGCTWYDPIPINQWFYYLVSWNNTDTTWTVNMYNSSGFYYSSSCFYGDSQPNFYSVSLLNDIYGSSPWNVIQADQAQAEAQDWAAWNQTMNSTQANSTFAWENQTSSNSSNSSSGNLLNCILPPGAIGAASFNLSNTQPISACG